MVEWDGLENRCTGNCTEGSNPSLSAFARRSLRFISGEGGLRLEIHVVTNSASAGYGGRGPQSLLNRDDRGIDFLQMVIFFVLTSVFLTVINHSILIFA